jgi:hypothetical protein
LESFRIAAAVSELQAVEPFSEVRDLRVLNAAEMSGQTVRVIAGRREHKGAQLEGESF